MLRQSGFLQAAAGLIVETPGLTAKEYAQNALSSGRAGSVARDPVLSLGNTLLKHYRDIDVERRKERGVFHFYPKAAVSPQASHPAVPPVTPGVPNAPQRDGFNIELHISGVDAAVVDSMLKYGNFATREAALKELVKQGIASLRAI